MGLPRLSFYILSLTLNNLYSILYHQITIREYVMSSFICSLLRYIQEQKAQALCFLSVLVVLTHAVETPKELS